MASVNKVILVGNLGRDPEVRYLPSGDPVANVSIATTSRYKSKTGEMTEETEWHRVTFFGRLAEIAGQYLKKGRPVYVEGRIKSRRYTDKDGIEKTGVDIIASEMQLLGGREGMGEPHMEEDGGAGSYGRSAPRAPAAPARAATAAAPAPQRSASGFDAMDDDIPF